MTLVYSTQLLAVQGLDGSQVYTVPIDKVLVIRDLDVYWGGSISNAGNVALIGSAGQTIWSTGSAGDGSSKSWSWRGRQVLESGEAFSVHTDTAMDVTVSGYLLTAP